MADQEFEAIESRDFYQRLRQRITRWTERKGSPQESLEYLLAPSDLLHLSLRLTIDSHVSLKNRCKLAATLVYVAAPIDLVPTALFGPVGLLDDIGLSAYVLRETIQETGRKRVKELWAGRDDTLILVEDVLDIVVEEMGLGAWSKVVSTLKSIG